MLPMLLFTCTYLYLWMMDHRSISFRAGPYHGSNHLASSWRSWLTGGASTMCCGKEFQLLTTLWEKKNFLESSLQCLLYSFRLCPLVCWPDSASWKKVLLMFWSLEFTMSSRRTCSDLGRETEIWLGLLFRLSIDELQKWLDKAIKTEKLLIRLRWLITGTVGDRMITSHKFQRD